MLNKLNAPKYSRSLSLSLCRQSATCDFVVESKPEKKEYAISALAYNAGTLSVAFSNICIWQDSFQLANATMHIEQVVSQR